MDELYKGWQRYQISEDLDNQLGRLHSSLKREFSSEVGFKLEISYLDYPNIFTVYNVIDKDFAKKVRKFINDIPFDNKLQN